MKKTIVILYNEISQNALADEADVLHQVQEVETALLALGYEPIRMEFSIDLKKISQKLTELKPAGVFNLVESVNNKGKFLFLAPALLEFLKIPYTGGLLESSFITTNKVTAKEKMKLFGLPTAEWFSITEIEKCKKNTTYIVKPIWEDGSAGIDSDSVFKGSDNKAIEKWKKLNPNEFFVEEFIEGREFNISILADINEAQVLPPAEICFRNFSDLLPKIVGFKAKWDEESFEYQNTIRQFKTIYTDDELYNQLTCITRNCWEVFAIKGYARVDYRVNSSGQPFILEINTNPCISPDSGFVAAAAQCNLTYNNIVARILKDAGIE